MSWLTICQILLEMWLSPWLPTKTDKEQS